MKDNNLSHKNKATSDWLTRTLEKVKSGELPVDQAVQELSILPYEDLSFAKVDHHRNMRVGFPEVIFGRGKTVEQIVTIGERLIARSDKVLITHAGADAFQAYPRKYRRCRLQSGGQDHRG